MNQETEKPPKVFVSYSHDSREHKMWVFDFSKILLNKGIDVILDQWDLRLGDDVTKFMEIGVRESDRVLMVCTEAYVRKSNDGEGGTGYETMVVTGELIKNLGTSKFIPIFRQNESRDLPSCIGTRFGINLNDNADFEEELTKLLQELHRVSPSTKPPLGRNPFSVSPSGKELPVKVVAAVSPNEDPYDKAIEIAKASDLVEWRRLLRETKREAYGKLREWRSQRESSRLDDLELINHTIEGISTLGPMMSIALAGIESGRDKFKNQISLLDDIMFPSEWVEHGRTLLIKVPFAAAFVYQALNGAMCIQTDQLPLALEIAKTRINTDSHISSPLWRCHDITGWPESFGGQSGTGLNAWKGLITLNERWPWIKKAFGDKYDFLASLCAHYIMLNILEYSTTLSEGLGERLAKGEIRLEVPLFAFMENEKIMRRGYKLLIRSPEDVRNIWRKLGIQDAQFAQYWDKWINLCGSWMLEVSRYSHNGDAPHRNLVKDLID